MEPNNNSLAPGAELLHYKLTVKLDRKPGGNVWSAEDTRLNRPVALKVISRSLSADSAQRDSLIRSLRLAAAPRHPNLITIRDIAAAGGVLFVVMEQIAGNTIRDLTTRGVMERDAILSTGFQLASAVAALHKGGVVHGNLTDETVMVQSDGRVKVGGFGLHALPARDQPASGSGRSWQVASPDSLSFVSPERLTGVPPDFKADIYAIGAMLYQLATRHHLFEGSTTAEVAQKITSGRPVSPATFNAGIGDDLVKVIGRAILKDPTKRFGSIDLILAEIEAMDPTLRRKLAAPVSAELIAREPVIAAPGISDQKVPSVPTRRIFLAADGGGTKAMDDPGRYRALQMLGEVIYLFEGKVLDPLAEIVVAEMPDALAALNACRHAKREIDEYEERGEERLPFRIAAFCRDVDHSGDIDVLAATSDATRLLESLESGEALVASEIWLDAGEPRSDQAKTIQGAAFYPLESAAPASPPGQSPAAVPGNHLPHAPDLLVEKRPPWVMIGIAALAIVALTLWLLLRGAGKESGRHGISTPASNKAAASVNRSQRLFFEPLAAAGDGEGAVGAATNLRRAVIEIFRDARQIDIAPESSADTTHVIFRAGQASTWIPSVASPGAAETAGPALDVANPGSALETSVVFISKALGMNPPPVPATPAGLTAFVEAAAFHDSTNPRERARATLALRQLNAADPSFLPAQRLAMKLYAVTGDRAALVASALKVAELDPANTDALHALAKANFQQGKVAEGISMLARVRERNPDDQLALERLAAYSVGAGDAATFQRLVAKFPSGMKTALHGPDLLMAAGKIDAAAEKYYELEAQDAQHAALAMKLGRIAVLRRSKEIAKLELDKLDRIEPEGYRAHLLRAYIAAEGGDMGQTEDELAQASRAVDRGDDFFTSSADVYAMLNKPDKVVASIEKSIQASEPTSEYLLNSSLFGYLATDGRFMRVREKIRAARDAMRSAITAAHL